MVYEYLTSFALGVAANLNPCVLPLYPGYLSYLANRPDAVNDKNFTRWSGFLVLAGVLAFMIVVGAITAGLGLSITNFVNIASPIAYGILFILGILLIFNVNLTGLLPQWKTPVTKNPYMASFVFGLLYGPIVIPCNAPLVFAVFAFSATLTGFISSFGLFMAFGLGLGAPLVLLSLFSTAKSSWLVKKFTKYHTPINRIAGVLLVLLSSYELLFVFRIFGG